MLVTTEKRRSHAEALRRLGEIAEACDAEPSFPGDWGMARDPAPGGSPGREWGGESCPERTSDRPFGNHGMARDHGGGGRTLCFGSIRTSAEEGNLAKRAEASAEPPCSSARQSRRDRREIEGCREGGRKARGPSPSRCWANQGGEWFGACLQGKLSPPSPAHDPLLGGSEMRSLRLRWAERGR